MGVLMMRQLILHGFGACCPGWLDEGEGLGFVWMQQLGLIQDKKNPAEAGFFASQDD
jgi:hypothetical protein